MSVYFGGSRSLPAQCFPLVGLVVAQVVASGQSVHVGCQFGADQQVTQSCPPLSLFVFTVAAHLQATPAHVQRVARAGASVVCGAGGVSAPVPARYLLRSIAAFRGCSQAVFFAPGTGSLAVARQCVRAGLPVFAFNISLACGASPMSAPPPRVPSVSGQWVTSSFMGFACWQWSAPQQASLF